MLVHSQTWSAFWDESFHLNAARLISNGKLPYADFFYQHTPLFAYLSAAWMRVFGESWRSVHVLSSLMAIASIFFITTHVFRIIPDTRLRYHAATVAAILVGLNTLVVRFATIGQPYAFCLLLVVASFMLATRSVYDRKPLAPFWAGLCAGGALSASLLTAPVAPIELAWMLRQSSATGIRARAATRFVAGFAVALIPLLTLFVKAPRATFFDVIEYHAFYRGWPSSHETVLHQLRTFSSWTASPQAILLVVLAVIGVVSIGSRSAFESRIRAELRLCVWLAAGLTLYSMIPFPTFAQYYIFVVPFLGILAAAGFYAIGARTGARINPIWLTMSAFTLYALGLGVSIRRTPYFYRGMYWPGMDAVARAVNRVTLNDELVYADDGNVYFAAGRAPAPGLENDYGTGLKVSSPMARALHVVLQPELDSSIRAGKFASVVLCSRQDDVDSLRLAQVYAQREEFVQPRCLLFWGLRAR